MPVHQPLQSKLTYPLPGYILAGGRSSRFPGDKALQLIHGQPQLQRLVQQLSASCSSVQVIADRAGRYESLGLTCLTDHFQNCGPIGGLATALSDRLETVGEGWLLLVSCDQLLWDASWLNGFSQLLRDATTDYGVAIWQDSQLSPLPGLYHTRVIPLVETACHLGRCAFRDLLCQSAIATYCCTAMAGHPRQFSFNTPDELRHLLSQLHPETRVM